MTETTNDAQTQSEPTGERTTVLWEGVPTVDGRLINKDAIHWDNPPLPVMERYDAPKNAFRDTRIYGYMTRIRREDDGRITAVVSPPIPEGKALGPDLDSFFTDPDVTDQLIFVEARLRAATIVDKSAWHHLDAPVDETDTPSDE